MLSDSESRAETSNDNLLKPLEGMSVLLPNHSLGCVKAVLVEDFAK